MARLRAARRPPARPVMVNITGNHDGTSRGRLHGQPGHGLPLGHRAAQPRRCRSTTCCPPGTRSPARSRPPACWPPSATAAQTGEGQLVSVALSDVAFAMVGNLGKIAEAQLQRRERPKDGNYLYGAFGRDFLTKDGRRIMIVALTLRQWRSLVEATGLGEAFATLEQTLDVDLARGGRPLRGARGASARCIKPWTIARTLAEIREIFDAPRRLLGPVPDVPGAGRSGPALLDRQPDVRGGRAAGHRHLPDAGLAAELRARVERVPVRPAPVLGEHTDEVLAEVLGLSASRDRPAARQRCRRGFGRRTGLVGLRT